MSNVMKRKNRGNASFQVPKGNNITILAKLAT